MLLWAFAAGVGVWPMAKVYRLCKLAWRRQAAAAQRVLLVQWRTLRDLHAGMHCFGRLAAD